MQAVNDSQQFWSIARTSNHYFIKQIKTLRSHQRIFLSRVSFDDFMNESEIDDEQLIVVSKSYSNVVKSSIRLYVHSCFAVSGFAKLCEVYLCQQWPLFSFTDSVFLFVLISMNDDCAYSVRRNISLYNRVSFTLF